MSESRTLNALNAQTCPLFINSEADVIVDGRHVHKWEAWTDVERACDALHGELMGHFRNWSRSRTGGAFSDAADCCWLPNACVTADGRVLGLMSSTELSSRDNAFIARPDGPERAALGAAVDRLVASMTVAPTVTVAKREYEPGYFEIDVSFPPERLADGVAACLSLGRGIAADPVLSAAREWIG